MLFCRQFRFPRTSSSVSIACFELQLSNSREHHVHRGNNHSFKFKEQFVRWCLCHLSFACFSEKQIDDSPKIEQQEFATSQLPMLTGHTGTGYFTKYLYSTRRSATVLVQSVVSSYSVK